MKRNLLIASALMLLSAAGMAQDKLKEGKLTFEISVPDAEEMNDQMLAMMPKEMTVYFKKNMSRTEMMMMGSNVFSITDKAKEETVTYMELMGKKTAMKITREDAEKRNAMLGDYEVKMTDETKTIAGYPCKKAVVTMKKDDKTFEVWFTKDLDIPNSGRYSWKGIDGFMMEFTFQQGNMAMKFVCTDVKKQTVDDSLFVGPEGYTFVTADDMKKMYGGAH